jgi:hypothetical protein
MNDKVIQLHDRITVTFSPKVSRLIREEQERQIGEGRRRQTIEEIVEDAVTHHCEALAIEWIPIRK